MTATACAPVREEEPASGTSVEGPLFYPDAPASPRIQHLATYSSERDVARPGSSFENFVLGDERRFDHLVQPYGVAMHAGKLYVVDTGAARIAVFDLVNRKFQQLAFEGSGRLKRPINITIDSDGTKFVTDTGRNQVLVYGPDDRFVTAFGSSGQFKPVDVEIRDDALYVVDVDHHKIHVIDKRTGESRFSFGKAGSGEGELFHPTNIATGPGGDLYVVETSNFRVQRFKPDGRPVRSYGSIGDAPGSFARPKGLAFDREGRMYVGDAAFENVQVFDADGRLLLFFGTRGAASQRLNLPAGVAVDYDHVSLFQRLASPGFKLDYVILVASQYGPNKVDVFGFGELEGADYTTPSGAGGSVGSK